MTPVVYIREPDGSVLWEASYQEFLTMWHHAHVVMRAALARDPAATAVVRAAVETAGNAGAMPCERGRAVASAHLLHLAMLTIGPGTPVEVVAAPVEGAPP